MAKQMELYTSCPAENLWFKKSIVEMNTAPESTEVAVVNLFDDVIYQEILGFGGAFTEAAAYVYSQMDDATKKRFIKAYFDREEGIGYNFGRTHINSCDFALDIYTYVEEGDKTLSTFDISRDQKYILPFLKDALEYCKEELILFASPWSPPAYMKDNNSMIKGGKLLEEYKSAWAHYYAKYIKAFAAEGIRIDAVSIQNEPMARQTWESCNYTAEDEADFIEQYLITALDEEGLSDLKIIIWDHNKERVYDRAKKTLRNENVNSRVWAIGHHWYTGDHFEGLDLVHEQLGKPVICTEFCGEIEGDVNALAERYGVEMCENLNHYDIASCDWNLLLNQKGGPFHNRTADSVAIPGVVHDVVKGGCFAPILYDTDKEELVLTPIYYYIGHFSKWIERGAVRIATTKYTKQIYTCAFRNPDGTLIAVLVNTADHELPAFIRLHDGVTPIQLPAHSIMTVKI